MTLSDLRCARPWRAALLVVSSLGPLGCNTTVMKADPEDWTVERALAVIREVESRQVEAARLWVGERTEEGGVRKHNKALGLPHGGPETWPGTGDSSGFQDFHFVSEVSAEKAMPPRGSKEGEPEKPTVLEIVGTVLLVTALFVLLLGFALFGGEGPGFGGGGSKSLTHIETSRVYGFRHIAFADIARVVVERKANPFLCLLVVFPAWWHDVFLEMKDGTRVAVYEKSDESFQSPLLLYPLYWLKSPEGCRYAEAIEYLRARAASEVPGDASSER